MISLLSALYSTTLLDEAKSYCGKRIELINKIMLPINEMEKEHLEKIVEIHTQLMKENKINKGFVWEAKWEDKTVYIIGTVHSNFTSDVHPYMTDLVQKTNKLYVEYKSKGLEKDKEADKLLRKIQKKKMENIENLSIDWESLYSKDLAMTIQHELMFLKGGTENGLNILKGNRVKGIEDGLKRLHGMPTEVQNKDGIVNVALMNELIMCSLDAYQWQNKDSLENVLKMSSTQDLTKWEKSRNPDMTNKIFSNLQKGKSGVFAIGAAHMLGENSILSLLEKKGVQITQSKY